MHVKIEARILIFPGTTFHFPSTSVPPGTFLGSARESGSQLIAILSHQMRAIFFSFRNLPRLADFLGKIAQ